MFSYLEFPRALIQGSGDENMSIGNFHNGSQIKYSFVLMKKKKSLSSVARTSKFQKNICFKMRAVGLIKQIQKNVNVVAIYESGVCIPFVFRGERNGEANILSP